MAKCWPRFRLPLIVLRSRSAEPGKLAASSSIGTNPPTRKLTALDARTGNRTTRSGVRLGDYTLRWNASSYRDSEKEVVTYRKQASRMASFGAVRNDRKPLSNPHQTHDLYTVNLRPNRTLDFPLTGLSEPLRMVSLRLQSRSCAGSGPDRVPIVMPQLGRRQRLIRIGQ
jgi:hypothetical protein